MRMQFFGDSYDVVKRFLLHTIAPEAKWIAFPMFTHEVAADDITAFEAFLGVSIASHDAITKSTDRAIHLSALTNHRHVFLARYRRDSHSRRLRFPLRLNKRTACS